MVTQEEVEKIQEEWAKGLVEMGSLANDQDKLRTAADRYLDQLYAFDNGHVLFKPTLAAIKPFRLDKKGALSYFIGGDVSYAEDTGFACKQWVSIKFENKALILETHRAIAMGSYCFTDGKNNQIIVEYTFGFIKATNGQLKIDVHHSSLPYQP